MISNRDRISRALDSLITGMTGFVERELKATYQDRWREAIKSSFRDNRNPANLNSEKITWDAHSLLMVMWDQWPRVFRQKLTHRDRSLVSELRDYRNRWAHQAEFDFDDTYRILDSIQRLLQNASQDDAAVIARDKADLLRTHFSREARAAYQKTQSKKRKWQDVSIYGLCGASLIYVTLMFFGMQYWMIAVLIGLLFSYLAYQRVHVIPPFYYGPHECGVCGKIIYGHSCPYCDE